MSSTRQTWLGALLALALGGCMRTPEPEDPQRFLRLDAQGQPAAEGAVHHCLYDRRSELTWAVPVAGDAWRDPAHRYSWYSEDKAVHLGDAGRRDGGRCGGERCDTGAMVAAVADAGLCGHHDWRLPSREEAIVLGKVHGGQTIGRHSMLFPGVEPGEVWTATTFRMYAQSAWAIDTGNGLDRADLKQEAKQVRLVRGTLVLRQPRKDTP